MKTRLLIIFPIILLLFIGINESDAVLNEKYSHLNPYFCSLNMLNEFRLTYNPHKPKDNQIIGV